MKVHLIGLVFFAAFAHGAVASEIDSAQTTIDRDADCSVVAASEESDGRDLICAGYRGYPIRISYSDGREVATYGFDPSVRMPNLLPFNDAADTVEWRIRQDEQTSIPFATIHRWNLTYPEGIEGVNALLVISKLS